MRDEVPRDHRDRDCKKVIEMGRESSVVEINPSYIATWKF